MKLHSLIAFTADWLYADFGAAGLDGRSSDASNERIV
jgi:hypothetical protein